MMRAKHLVRFQDVARNLQTDAQLSLFGDVGLNNCARVRRDGVVKRILMDRHVSREARHVPLRVVLAMNRCPHRPSPPPTTRSNDRLLPLLGTQLTMLPNRSCQLRMGSRTGATRPGLPCSTKVPVGCVTLRLQREIATGKQVSQRQA